MALGDDYEVVVVVMRWNFVRCGVMEVSVSVVELMHKEALLGYGVSDLFKDRLRIKGLFHFFGWGMSGILDAQKTIHLDWCLLGL